MSDAVIERVLAILGETVHPDRLRQFDDSFAFELERAATEYSPAESE